MTPAMPFQCSVRFSNSLCSLIVFKLILDRASPEWASHFECCNVIFEVFKMPVTLGNISYIHISVLGLLIFLLHIID